MIFPDGMLAGDVIVYPGVISRGYELVLPDLRQAASGAVNDYMSVFETFFVSLPPEVRASFQQENVSDFQTALDDYARVTAGAATGWCRRVREERLERYSKRMREGQLLRRRMVLFLSRREDDLPGLISRPFGLEERYRRALQQSKSRLDEVAGALNRALAAHGGHVRPCQDADHHRHFSRFLNPSFATRPGFDPISLFDPGRSIHANCWLSEAAGQGGNFYMDGFHHALRVFTRWAPLMTATSLSALWELRIPNLRITINAHALDIPQLIANEERDLRRLESQHAVERRPSLLVDIEKKRRRIEQLAARLLKPFKVEIIVHTWARSLAELATQSSTIEQTIHACGAQYFAPSLPTTCKRLFAQTWPGFPWGAYTHYQLYAESNYLPFLTPALASSFTGYLNNKAEVLLESPDGSPVGLRTISGGQPLHMAICAGTGGGKSVLLGEILSQIACLLGSMVIIDFGGTHETLVRALNPNARSIILHPNSGITINYVANTGLPLTNEHLSDVATLVVIMTGTSTDERVIRLRRVAVVEALKSLHTSRFNQLERQSPERALAIARHALAIRRRAGTNTDSLEAFIDFRDWQAAHPGEAAELLAGIGEAEAVEFLKTPSTRMEAVCLACASLTDEEQPTHEELRERLHLQGAAKGDSMLRELAELMKEFSAGGSAGRLFAGHGNVSLDQPVLHLELGRLDPRNPAMLAAASHLAHVVAQRNVQLLPRFVRKLHLFEEASSFLAHPGAADLLRRSYEQARKLNVLVASVFQNYARLKDSPVGPTILANAQQFLLMKQDSLPDLKLWVEDLGLPTSMIATMSQFPRPASAGYADFTLFCRDTPHPICGVTRHIPSKEMMYVTNSTPANIEARRAALREEGDILARIQKAVS